MSDKEFTEAECAAARERMADVVREASAVLGAGASAEGVAGLAARVVINRKESDPAMFREAILAWMEPLAQEYLDERVAKGELVKVRDGVYEGAPR